MRDLLTILLLLVGSSYAFSQGGPPAEPSDWATDAERSGYTRTPRYRKTISFSKRLATASPMVEYRAFGKSGEGRDLPLLIADRDREFSPSAARKRGKAVILIQAAIHAGEPDGKDAGLALLRDIAVTGKRSGLLDGVVILFVPIYNVDGHELFGPGNRINQNGPLESGFRATSSNLNLNRDYLKADAPETVAWLRLWNEWDPDFFIDCHVTDGADFRYNITYEYARHGEISSHLRSWMRDHFLRSVLPKVEAEGNILSHYLQFADRGDPLKGVYSFIASPRFATGYTALRNRNGLLIEAHSLKDYRSRVKGTYDVLRFMIEEIGRNRDSLFRANRAADREAEGRGASSAGFPLLLRPGGKPGMFAFKGYKVRFLESEVSGRRTLAYTAEPLNVTIPWYDDASAVRTVMPPAYYIVPPQFREAVRRIKAHGIEFAYLKETKSIEIETYSLTEPKWAARPFEGRNTLRVKPIPFKETRVFPKGSLLIPIDQKLSAVAIHLLEPASPDSLVFWGFFNAIFERKEYAENYALEKLAREMLSSRPELKKEFEEKLKDPKFAADPRARLNFFYTRSRYFENRVGLYPIGRIMERDSGLE